MNRYLLLSVLLTCAVVSSVGAETPEEKRQLREAQSEVAASLDDKRLDALEALDAARQKLRSLEADVEAREAAHARLIGKQENLVVGELLSAGRDVANAKARLLTAEAQIAELKQSIAVAKADVAAADEAVAKRVRLLATVFDEAGRTHEMSEIDGLRGHAVRARDEFRRLRLKLARRELQAELYRKDVVETEKVLAGLRTAAPELVAKLEKSAASAMAARLAAEQQRTVVAERQFEADLQAQIAEERQARQSEINSRMAEYQAKVKNAAELARSIEQTESQLESTKAAAQSATQTVAEKERSFHEIHEQTSAAREKESELDKAYKAAVERERQLAEAAARKKEADRLAALEAERQKRIADAIASKQADEEAAENRLLRRLAAKKLARTQAAERKALLQTEKDLVRAAARAEREAAAEQERIADLQASRDRLAVRYPDNDERLSRVEADLQALEAAHSQTKAERDRLRQNADTVLEEWEQRDLQAWKAAESMAWQVKYGISYRKLDSPEFFAVNLPSFGDQGNGTFAFGPGGPGNNSIVNGPFGVQSVTTPVNEFITDDRFEGQTFSDDGDFSNDVTVALDYASFNGEEESFGSGYGTTPVLGLQRDLMRREGFTVSAVGNMQFTHGSLSKTHDSRIAGTPNFTTGQSFHTIVDVDDVANDGVIIAVINPTSGTTGGAVAAEDNSRFALNDSMDIDMLVLDLGLAAAYHWERAAVNLALGPTLTFSKLRTRQTQYAAWSAIESSRPPLFAGGPAPITIAADSARIRESDEDNRVSIGAYLSLGVTYDISPRLVLGTDLRYDVVDGDLSTNQARINPDAFSVFLSLGYRF